MTVVRVPRRAVRAIVVVAFAVYVATILAWCAVEVGSLFAPRPVPEPFPIYYAVFEPAPAPAAVVPLEATAYCACPICCGRWSDGRTASGTRATAGRTLAADPALFTAGTCLSLEGLGRRIVEDTGSAIVGARIDVYFDTHQAALEFGRQFVSWGKC